MALSEMFEKYAVLMDKSMAALCEEDETLRCAFYGSLLPLGFFRTVYSVRYGFFGLTNKNLLIALPRVNSTSEIEWTTKIPLDIKKIKVHKSLFPYQYVAYIAFVKGKPCKIRMSKKLIGSGFGNQSDAIDEFIAYLKNYANADKGALL